jgi:hypothetical protein
MQCDTSKLDQKLLRFWDEARQVYNTAAQSLSEEIAKLDSVKITSLLVRHSYRFSDAALMLAANDDLLPAAALMRTAIEAQAVANHLISFTGPVREQKAAELFRLSKLNREYHSGLMMKSISSVKIDWANVFNWSPEARAQVAKLLAEFDSAQFDSLREERGKLSNDWKYGKVIGRKFFDAPHWNSRTPIQRVQQTLDVLYNLYCSAVHPDPSACVTEKLLSAHDLVSAAATVAVYVVYCYLVTIGRQEEPRFKQLVADYSKYAWSNLSESITN